MNLHDVKTWLRGALKPKEPDPEPPDLWAFWHYDLFPFYLSGKVERIEEEGKLVVVEGFGYYRFKQTAIIPGKRGEELHRYLKAAKQTHKMLMEGVETAAIEAVARRLSQDNLPGRFRKTGFMFGPIQKIFEQQVEEALSGRRPLFKTFDPEAMKKTAEKEK